MCLPCSVRQRGEYCIAGMRVPAIHNAATGVFDEGGKSSTSQATGPGWLPLSGGHDSARLRGGVANERRIC